MLFFSLALVLLGAEVFVRYYDPQILSFLHSRKSFAPPIYQANDKWLFELRPGTDYLHESPYKDFQVSVRVNREGFRGPEVKLAKPPGTFRIFFLGDSFTFGLGVENDETYPALLGVKLNQGTKNGHRYEIINGGVPGYNLAHYYLVLKHKVFRYNPDLVVVGILPWNDWNLAKQEWGNEKDGLPGFLREGLFVDAEGRVRLKGEDVLRVRSTRFNFLPEVAKRFLREHSHFYHFLGERLYRLRKNLSRSSRLDFWGRASAAEVTEDSLRIQGLSPKAIRAKLQEQDRENWLKGLALLEAMVQLAKDRSVPLAVILIPHLYESHQPYLTPQFTHEVGRPGQNTGNLLLRWLKKRGVPYLNLVRILDPYDEKRLYLRYDKHFAPLGNRVLARTLVRFLGSNDLLSKRMHGGEKQNSKRTSDNEQNRQIR